MKKTEKISEQPSRFDHLEQMSVGELLQHINEEDCLVAEAVGRALPEVEALVEAIEPRMKRGGRLFYIGAGTSGRLGVLDASELPPTFGVPDNWVTGIIAGGDQALRHAVERAEDIVEQGWEDLQAYHPTALDTVIGIAASGTTPYVVGAVKMARQHGLLTGCITSNPQTPLAHEAEFPIETIVGPEFVTGSSRMKSGTAQKMVLNMISTTLMIRMGRVQGNRMVNMQLTNDKLIDRGTRMLQESLGLGYEEARQRLLQVGSVSDCLGMPQLLTYDLGEGVRAFTTTRRGGCSTGNYGSFNINPYCGDEAEHVAANRKALCRLLDIPDDRLLLPHQTHETRIACIDNHFLALSAQERQARLEGIDALMTQERGVCIGVSTADCIPLLLFDPEHRAICAVHAGWRGTVSRIAEKAVAAMTQTFGTRPEALVAQIGPGISLDSFEVGQEVYDAFAAAGFSMSAISRRFPSGKWHIDLPLCNRRQLLSSGLRGEAIHQSGTCTVLQHDTFFSARKLGIHSGRLFTAAMLL